MADLTNLENHTVLTIAIAQSLKLFFLACLFMLVPGMLPTFDYTLDPSGIIRQGIYWAANITAIIFLFLAALTLSKTLKNI